MVSTAARKEETAAGQVSVVKEHEEQPPVGFQLETRMPTEKMAATIERPMVRVRVRGVTQFYAIAIGRQPRIYVSWEAASRQVIGFLE